jgi:hypothetical protein
MVIKRINTLNGVFSGITRHNIKIDPKKIGREDLDWIHLAQDIKSGVFRFHKIWIISSLAEPSLASQGLSSM